MEEVSSAVWESHTYHNAVIELSNCTIPVHMYGYIYTCAFLVGCFFNTDVAPNRQVLYTVVVAVLRLRVSVV